MYKMYACIKLFISLIKLKYNLMCPSPSSTVCWYRALRKNYQQFNIVRSLVGFYIRVFIEFILLFVISLSVKISSNHYLHIIKNYILTLTTIFWVKIIFPCLCSQNELVCCGVLSGNRNFEGRIHPNTRANYLASPLLVIAYAIAGRMDIDFETEPIGEG